MTRRQVWALGMALLLAYAYFYQAGGWNQNSRFDLIRALAEHGTVRIDAYAQNTGDKATFEGHTYSDKAPGQALTAVPPVALADWLAHLTARDLTSDAREPPNPGLAGDSPNRGLSEDAVALLAYLATV